MTLSRLLDSNLVKSEFRKLIYAKTYYGYLGGAVFIALISSVPAAFSLTSLKAQLSGLSLMDPALVAEVYGKAISGYLFVIILGIAIVGNEFQNGQAISTYLATPQRHKVLIAKLLVAAGAGVFVMVISTVIGFAGAYIGLSHYKHAATSATVFVNLLLAAALSGAVIAVIGVAIGSLVRNVKIAQSGAVIWLAVVEKLIVLFWATGGKFLPSGLILGMMNINIDIKSTHKFLDISTSNYFGPGISTLLLLIYALVFASVGSWITMKRDVD
jgi:ABC-type transport system involved in multi-copper enzyme maturation permease subunit